MYTALKLATVMIGLLVLAGCGSDGKIEFKGEYDPESGVVSVDLGNGTTSASVAVDLPGLSAPPEGGTLPSVDDPRIIEESGGDSPSLITVDPEEDPAEFLRLIPAEERGCLEDRIGAAAPEDFLKDLPPGGEEIILECVSEETIRRVMLGMLAREAGQLSDQAVSCLTHELEGADFRDGLNGESPFLESVLIPRAALQCLSHEQLVRLGVVGLDGPTADQLRCVFEYGDQETLALLTGGGESPEVLRLFAECGFDGDPEGYVGYSGPSPEQASCVKEGIGYDAFQELIDGQRRPTTEEMEIIADCGVYVGRERRWAEEALEDERRRGEETLQHDQQADWDALSQDQQAARDGLDEQQQADSEALDEEYESVRRAIEDAQREAWDALDREQRSGWNSLDDELQRGNNGLEDEHEATRRALEDQQHADWETLGDEYQGAREAIEDELEAAWNGLDKGHKEASRALSKEQRAARQTLEDQYEASRQALEQELYEAWEALEREYEGARDGLADGQTSISDEIARQQDLDRQALEQEQALEAEHRAAWDALDDEFRTAWNALEDERRQAQEARDHRSPVFGQPVLFQPEQDRS